MNAPFRLTAPEPMEKDLQRGVVKALRQLLMPPAMFWHVPNGAGDLPPAVAGRLFEMGLLSGIPDLEFLFEGRSRFMELKRRNGALSRSRIIRTKRGRNRYFVGQAERAEQLRAAGAPVVVCRSREDVLLQVDAWGLPLRPGWRSMLGCEVAP